MTDRREDPVVEPTGRRLIDVTDEDRLLFSLAVPALSPTLEPKLHGAYCGPGGRKEEAPYDETDGSCEKHDQCYDRAGVDAFNRSVDAVYVSRFGEERAAALPFGLTAGQREAAEACDRQLCDDVARTDRTSLTLYEDKVVIPAIEKFFACPIPDPTRGGGPER